MNFKSIAIFITYVLVSSLVISCTGNDVKLTIPEDKLIKVFFDLYAADHAIEEAPKEKRDSLKEAYTKQVFQIHNLKQKEFEYNLSQLQKNPDKFKKFYDKLDKYGEEMSMKKEDDAIPENKK